MNKIKKMNQCSTGILTLFGWSELLFLSLTNPAVLKSISEATDPVALNGLPQYGCILVKRIDALDLNKVL
uniref:Uncharacterized protein n=1 Tax=Timema cristinae TaxID=61476 RepID=A0A7R9CL64_TIMCR|nr:unnamed protein product [Timema cristinae]